MMVFIKRLYKLIFELDLFFFLYEKYSLFKGFLQVLIIKTFYFNRFEIGSNYKIWGNIRFLFWGNGKIKIGDNFHCVSSEKRSFLTLFSKCHLTVIENGSIKIGNNVGLNGTTIVSKKNIFIGDRTMIAPNTIIMDYDGHVSWPLEERWTNQGISKEIIIENDVWIGLNCVILKGVTIKSGSIIGPGSVVINNVESNSLYAGNPAKKIKDLF